jgi:hypothetical protein
VVEPSIHDRLDDPSAQPGRSRLGIHLGQAADHQVVTFRAECLPGAACVDRLGAHARALLQQPARIRELLRVHRGGGRRAGGELDMGGLLVKARFAEDGWAHRAQQ